MSTTASAEIHVLLSEDYIALYPDEATELLETLPVKDTTDFLAQMSETGASEVFRRLSPVVASDVLLGTDGDRIGAMIASMDPPRAGALLSGLDEKKREYILSSLGPIESKELRDVMQYPLGSAGRLMDPRISLFRPHTEVEQALERLRALPPNKRVLNLLVVDEERRLIGVVSLQAAALAPRGTTLGVLMKGAPACVSELDTREDVVAALDRGKLTGIPVVDFDHRPVGVIRLEQLVSAVEQEAGIDLLSMVGAGREERALSKASFAIRKRLPWLQINLATAFLAASVVGLFEETISQFTALAVLLPVVAGQSGNTGAQALAVTLRGLALREITFRHWPKLVAKEFVTGALNGVAVAFVTGIGVYVWSGSLGLTSVIGVAMVISMAIAGVAGAAIPVVLSVLGQDPAQSSSIVLTTVTDVFGFFSFLGLATAFSSLL